VGRERKDSGLRELNFGEGSQVGVPGFALELERGELALTADLDKSSLLKLLQVMGHGCSSDRLALPKRGAGDFIAVRNLFEDGEAARVRNCAGNGVDSSLFEEGHGLQKIYINYSMRA